MVTVIGILGLGGGQVISMLSFFSNDVSLNPAEAYSFSLKVCDRENENVQKEATLAHLKNLNVK